MKLATAAMIACDIEELMLAADRPDLCRTWPCALAKLRDDSRCRGVRFRPRQSDTDWCIGNIVLLEKMCRTLQLSWCMGKDEFFLAKLRGTLEPLEQYALFCKIEESMWHSSNYRTEPWGGFSFESTYYIGEENPWPNFIGDVL
jgi:hypothetical protein